MFTYRKKMAKCRLDKEEIILADYLSRFLTQTGLTLNNIQLPWNKIASNKWEIGVEKTSQLRKQHWNKLISFFGEIVKKKRQKYVLSGVGEMELSLQLAAPVKANFDVFPPKFFWSKFRPLKIESWFILPLSLLLKVANNNNNVKTVGQSFPSFDSSRHENEDKTKPSQ